MSLIDDVIVRIIEKVGSIKPTSIIPDNTSQISSLNASPMRAKLNCYPFNTGAAGRPVSSPGPSCIDIIPE